MSLHVSVRGLRVGATSAPRVEIEALEVSAGTTLALFGPNGAGKTTLLRSIGLLESVDAGEVAYDGVVSFRKTDRLHLRRRISTVFQSPILFTGSVFDNVAAPLRFRKSSRAEIVRRTRSWLDRLSVLHLADSSARSISGGEAQRVALARAFVSEPELLLLDEPFSSLDEPTRLELIGDLGELVRVERPTTVFASHARDDVIALADQVAVLMDGRLRQIGSPSAVFGQPTDADVAAFVGVSTLLAGTVIGSGDGVVGFDVAGIRIQAMSDFPVGAAVMAAIRPEDVAIEAAGEGRATSVQNHCPGIVREIRTLGAVLDVRVDCGFEVVAAMTRGSAERLGLAPGTPVIASFRAAAVHLMDRPNDDSVGAPD